MDTTVGHSHNDGFVLTVIKKDGQVAADYMSFLENQPEINKLISDHVINDEWLASIKTSEKHIVNTIVFDELDNGQWRCVPIELNVSPDN